MKESFSLPAQKLRIFLSVIILSCWVAWGNTQIIDLLNQDLSHHNFFEWQDEINSYYKTNPGAGGYKQWKRQEMMLQERIPRDGRMINFNYQNFKEYITYKTQQTSQRSIHGNWIFFGPSSVIPGFGGNASLGRLNTICIHPDNPDIIYVGASSGGIWKSINGGINWTNISPYIPTLSIKDIVMIPGNPEEIYVLTGDGYSRAQPSLGIIYSNDGGETWAPTGLFNPDSIFFPHKLVINPDFPNIQFAAMNIGIFRTTDYWQTYTFLTSNVPVFDIEFKPGSPSTVYISLSGALSRSTQNGQGGTFSTMADPDLAALGSRVEIAVSPDNPNMIYAFSANNEPVGLFRSEFSGDNNTWTVQDTSIDNLGSQGNYNMGLEVDPNNDQQVMVGMVWTKTSLTGGTPESWQGPTNYVHADVHKIINRDDNLYHANDGGFFKSIDQGVTFSDLSAGLEITEIYGIAGTPQNSSLYYMGTQDNGTLRRTAGSTFTHVEKNDGGNCMIDYTNSQNVYATYQQGFLVKSTNGGNSFDSINPPGSGAWVSPLLMDPSDPNIIFIGKYDLFRSNSGGSAGSWVNLGKPAGTVHYIEMAQGTDNRNRMYATFGPENFYRTNDALIPSGNANWTSILPGLPPEWISGIAVNPDNANHVFVVFSGYNDGQKVFSSTNSGNAGSWVNITGSLPNVPVNCIRYHDNGLGNNSLYIGTDIGVFYRDDDLGDWIFFSNNLPVTIVLDLFINTASNIIAAGCYGRGLWISTLYTDCSSTLNLTNPSGSPIGGVRYFSASQSIESTAEHRKDLGTEIHYTSGNFIDLNPGFSLGGIAYFDAKIGSCPPILDPPNVMGSPQNRNENLNRWKDALLQKKSVPNEVIPIQKK